MESSSTTPLTGTGKRDCGGNTEAFSPDSRIEECTRRLNRLRYELIPEKRNRTVELEKSMLDFYYQREIHDEQSVMCAPHREDHHNSFSGEKRLTRGKGEEGVGAVTAFLPAYYQRSEWGQLIEQKRSFRRVFDKEYATELEKVQKLEESVEKEIVQGSFAAKRDALIQEEQALKALEATLEEKKEDSKRLQQQIHREEEAQIEVAKEKSEWETKKRRLEDAKQAQQSNVDGIREELRAAEDKLSRAKIEFQQRELTIQHLKKLITDRSAQNKRREQVKKSC